MRATILTIGDELLIGQIVDSNAAWIGERLTEIGIRPIRKETVGDEKALMREALERGMVQGRTVIMTGGLGPTHDDLTRDVLSETFGAALLEQPEIVEHIRRRFERRDMEMPRSNRVQAMVPEGFEAILNQAGTAPALIGTYDHPEGRGLVAALPGVPYEMKAFMSEHVLPRLLSLEGAPNVRHKTLLTVGVSESALADHLGQVEEYLGDGVGLAFLPNLRGVRLRITAVGDVEDRYAALEAYIRENAGRWIYGEGDETLEEVVGRMLERRHLTVATAESCTGGYVAHRLTNVAGSSEWVLGGIVSYANEVKEQHLDVSAETLSEHGAVSRQTACAMAEGVRNRFGSDVGISTTGIMGPGGGTPSKPVGTFWMGIATVERTVAIKMQLGTDRLRNKERASTAVLDLLRQVLIKQDEA